MWSLPRGEWTVHNVLVLAGLVRLLLIFYADIHDRLFQVRYTDVDYDVYTDAARYMYNSSSPFARRTYRYTPLLAAMLTPTVHWPNFGKYLFALVDLFVGALIVEQIRATCSIGVDHERTVLLGLAVWLFNPLTVVVSSRGNADTLVCAAVIVCLRMLRSRALKTQLCAALVHGAVAMQLKIYPLIYLPSVFLHLCGYDGRRDSIFSCSTISRLLRNWRGYLYALTALTSFGATSAFWYRIYGYTYLREALFYHLHRVDVKHNFSPYFYLLYIGGDRLATKLLSSLAFLPQALAVVQLSFRYAHDLPVCWFFITLAFVSLNKVCTSQYFLWYICLLPLVLHKLNATRKEQCACSFWRCNAVYWFGAQGLWLFCAYLLEFRGINTMVFVWLASLLFLAVNVWLLRRLQNAYHWHEAMLEHVKAQ